LKLSFPTGSILIDETETEHPDRTLSIPEWLATCVQELDFDFWDTINRNLTAKGWRVLSSSSTDGLTLSGPEDDDDEDLVDLTVVHRRQHLVEKIDKNGGFDVSIQGNVVNWLLSQNNSTAPTDVDLLLGLASKILAVDLMEGANQTDWLTADTAQWVSGGDEPLLSFRLPSAGAANKFLAVEYEKEAEQAMWVVGKMHYMPLIAVSKF